MNLEYPGKPTRQSYGEALVELGKENENIVVLDADVSGATKTNMFAKEFPERFFNMGISEQDLMATSAGLSTCGKIPYASAFAVFATGRAYDQIRNSICYPNLNVKICATHSGVTVGEDGATHQMLEDIALMRVLPNMKVFSPSDELQTKWLIKEVSKFSGPAYVRLGRANTPKIYCNTAQFAIGKAIYIVKSENEYEYFNTELKEKSNVDVTIFSIGPLVSEAINAMNILAEKGISSRVVDIFTIKPIDKEKIIESAKLSKFLVSVEDHNVIGGLGSCIAEVLTENCPARLFRIGVEDTFGKSGKSSELLDYFGLTSDKIASKIMERITF